MTLIREHLRSPSAIRGTRERRPDLRQQRLSGAAEQVQHLELRLQDAAAAAAKRWCRLG
jgi:hypothetical protein